MFQNAGRYLTVDMKQHTTRPESTSVRIWEPRILHRIKFYQILSNDSVSKSDRRAFWHTETNATHK